MSHLLQPYLNPPYSVSPYRTPIFLEAWSTYKILTKIKIVGTPMLYKPPKRKFDKGHSKGQKRSFFCISTKSICTRSIYIANKVDISDKNYFRTWTWLPSVFPIKNICTLLWISWQNSGFSSKNLGFWVTLMSGNWSNRRKMGKIMPLLITAVRREWQSARDHCSSFSPLDHFALLLL